MEWLSNLLGMGGGQTSPFGNIASSLGIPTGAPGAPGSNVAGPPAPGQNQGLGLWGGGGANPGRNFGLNEAMNLIKGPQMQPPPQMNLTSGPRQPNPFMQQMSGGMGY